MQSVPHEPRRSALLIDEEVHWVRLPRDLLAAIITLLVMTAVGLIAIYGYSTTLAVTRDVRTAADSILKTILLVPVNLLEGLVGFFLPMAVLVDLAWHRRWRTLVTSIIAAASAMGIAACVLWLFTRFLPLSPITGQLTDALAEQSYLAFLPYAAIVSSIMTVVSSGKSTRTSRIGWPMLAVVLVLSVLQGNQSLPGAIITALLGILCGNLCRYAVGDVPTRSTDVDLLSLVWKAGIDARKMVRVDKISDDATRAWRVQSRAPLGYVDRFGVEQIQQILTKAGATLSHDATDDAAHQRLVPVDMDAVAQRKADIATHHPALADRASRSYLVEDVNGVVYLASVVDMDQHVVGALQSLWQRIVLTTTARTADSFDDMPDRFALMELVTSRSGVGHDRSMAVARNDTSQVFLTRVDGSTPLSDLSADEIPDSALDSVWEILNIAHHEGLAHGKIHAGVTTLLGDRVELVHWENGSIATSEIERRIDMAQAMAMMVACVGMERAIASAQRCLPRDQVVSLAPILQNAVIPAETRSRFSDKKQLVQLRDALSEHVPEVAETEPSQLYRFQPRTVITVVLGIVAVYILVGSINFEELKQTVTNASPFWMAAAFLASLITYVGAAMALSAYTAEKLNMWDATLVQLASSVVSLLAPAGFGHAALNLRYLQRLKVATPVAVATVTLVQVAQFLTTVAVLIVLSLATGEIGSLTMPSASVLAAIGVTIVAIAMLFLVRPLRRWIIRKIQPTVDQVWPRMVWLANHPSRLLHGFLASMIQTVAYVMCFGFTLASFGYTLPIVTLAITYLVSNSVGSVVPSPGGIGPVEAALTGGLTLAGVPTSIALSTAILYRLFTFWGTVPLGWVALRILTKRGTL